MDIQSTAIDSTIIPKYNYNVARSYCMTILPSAEIRQRYNNVVRICQETGEPVYLTKNGEGELVVMDIKAFERMKESLLLEEKILESYADTAAGAPMHSVDEVFAAMEKIVEDAK